MTMPETRQGGEPADEVLMTRAQAGDADAFAALYDRHSERAFRVARAICRDHGRAEDVVQEAFLAIWRSRASYRAEAANFQTWSMRITRNRAIDSFRQAAARPPSQASDTDSYCAQADTESVPPPEQALARGERDLMLASLRRLPEAQAEVIVLAFYGELSHSEIANQLEIPAGTVKGRMRLGLEKLRQEMDC